MDPEYLVHAPLHHIVFWHRRAFGWRQAQMAALAAQRSFEDEIGRAVRALPAR